MKLQVKLKVTEAGEVQTFDNGTRLLTIKAFEAGYRDEFGELKGKDQTHEIKVFNKVIDALPEILQKPWKGELKASLNLHVTSSYFTYEDREINKTELTLSKMEVIQ